MIDERFFKQAIEIYFNNDCLPGDIIDAFHKKLITSGISPDVTTRPEDSKKERLVVVADD